MNRFLRPLGLVGLITTLTSGCALAGDRARFGCPVDEECSDRTPDGLFFAGATFSDIMSPVGVPATAEGGLQIIRVLPTNNVSGPEYSGGFDANSSDESIFEISNSLGGNVEIIGRNEGRSYLRLLEPGTDLLLDRVSLRVEPLATVEIVPQQLFILESPADWALLAGETVSMVARLRTAGDSALADTSADFVGADIGTRLAWDAFEMSPQTAGDSEVSAAAGAQSFSLSVPVVASIDTLVPPVSTADLQLEATRTYCFTPQLGDTVVFGPTATFEVTSGLAIEAAEAGIFGPCVSVRALSEGTATIVAMAEGISASHDLEVVPVPDTGRASEPLIDEGRSNPGIAVAGERAMTP